MELLYVKDQLTETKKAGELISTQLFFSLFWKVTFDFLAFCIITHLFLSEISANELQTVAAV